jgi:aquaporin Z
VEEDAVEVEDDRLDHLVSPPGREATPSEANVIMLRMNDDTRKALAELLGSFGLTFAVGGSITAGVAAGIPVLIAVALAAGLMLAIMVTSLGHISGGHFNPAVTFGFLVTGRITSREAVRYWVFQFAGGVLAALILRAVWDKVAITATHLGAPALAPTVSTMEGFLLEMVMTFFLAFVVFATAVDKEGAFRIVAGFAIGLTIGVDILIGGPLTGAAMNPQVAFGLQLVGDGWTSASWIYYVACPLGAAIAALLYDRLFLRPREAGAVS